MSATTSGRLSSSNDESTVRQSVSNGTAGAATSSAPAPVVSGGAAILAQIRARKAAAAGASSVAVTASSAKQPAAATKDPSKVIFAYASQTGTATEIARNMHAEALQQGIKAEVMSLDELGFQNLTPQAVPLLVLVAASTGEGDAPDNANAFYLQIRKPQAEGLLKGMRFTVLGLGDSNYTRFMQVSRTLKTRLLDLGAELFYPAKEADEVDGLEDVVEPWTEGLWGALKKVMAGGAAAPGTAPATAPSPAAATAPATIPASTSPPVPVPAPAPAPVPAPASEVSAVIPATVPAAVASAPGPRPDPAPATVVTAVVPGAVGPAPAPAAVQPASGGAAILAQLRARKAAAAAAKAKAAAPPAAAQVVFAFASQTGTAMEIVRNLHAEAVQRGIRAEVTSLDELGFQNLTPQAVPLLVLVAASTGEGDAPDNANAFYLQIRKPQAEGLLKGMRFTVLGLGDSNYTRFMQVSRTLKTRLLDLGAELFYPAKEADEVDGLEDVVEPWTEGLWGELKKAMAGGAAAPATAPATAPAPAAPATASAPVAPAAAPVPAPSILTAGISAAATSASTVAACCETASFEDEMSYGLQAGLAPEGADCKGAPAPLPCRVKVTWDTSEDSKARALSLESSRPTPEELHFRDSEGTYSKEQPFWAEVSDARYETAAWSDRKVLHLELDLGSSGMTYEAGDSIGIVPVNPPELVAGTIKRLGLSPDVVFSVEAAGGNGKAALPHIPSSCTVAHALSHCCELLAAPKKSMLRMLAEHCSNADEKRTLIFFTSKAGRDSYQHEIVEHQPSLLDLLTRFPSCQPPFDALLDALPPLMPRLYSVTTSSAEFPDKLQVAFSVVRFNTRYGYREGVATCWLDRLCHGLTWQKQEAGGVEAEAATKTKVPIFLRRSSDFKPPQDLSKPVIMIGPGTGVAPFRGFLQNRRALLRAARSHQVPSNVAPAWLFFGCRREDEDYLYKADLQGFEEDGTLTQLKVAFSRAQAHKVYVQDLMKEHKAQLAALVDAGAYVFVCGDGAAMVKDVHAALLAAVKEHGGLSDEAAAQKLSAMVQDKRYIRDVWS